jgi:hypothetical protein
MRYEDSPAASGQIYSQSEGLHRMLLFTVSIALVVGIVLLVLGLRGRVLWLTTWSAMLIALSVMYLGADLLGYIR